MYIKIFIIVNFAVECSSSEDGMTEEDQPWTFQEVCQAFVAALSLGPVVIVIDGLDEIGNTLGLTIRQVSFHDPNHHQYSQYFDLEGQNGYSSGIIWWFFFFVG